MDMNINKIMPWFVACSACVIFYLLANFGGPLFPLEHKWTFYLPLFVVFVSLVVIVCCFFKIYAIFERMDQRDREMGIWK